MKLVIGSRASKLAIKQTDIVVEQLRAYYPDIHLEIKLIKTTGDRLDKADLSKIGGKGLFLKELEEHLLENTIDIAVHALKDVPAELPQGLEISTYLKRDNPLDVFLSNKYETLWDLPPHARIGTSSPRRAILLKALKHDIEIIPFRGNVTTRLAKLDEIDACVLAYAGLERLNLEKQIKHIFTQEQMLPAIGQGVICIEQRISDDKIKKLLAPLNETQSELCSTAERTYMKEMAGNCTTPMAAYATIFDNMIHLKAMYYDGKRILYSNTSGQKAYEVGVSGAELIKQQFAIKTLI